MVWKDDIKTEIYCSGMLYPGNSEVITDLCDSGFNTVIAWAMHVNESGDIVFNGISIIKNSEYIGDPSWPEYLFTLKKKGNVKNLTFSIGGWDVGDFPNIKCLIQDQGIGPSSILYKNFTALKSAIPGIDCIDLDDETLYDKPTMVQLCKMLNGLGFQVAFCPYNNTDFWVECLYDLESFKPGSVSSFNLQCYAGGAENNPQDWINAIADKMGPHFDAKGFVYPGLWCRNGNNCSEGDCPDEITEKFKTWKPEGIKGGFIWLYDDIQKCKNSKGCQGSMQTSDYAAAILKGLS